MVGFSGAVEDAARNIGMILALVVALVLGWAYGSWLIGGGAFVAGTLIANLYAVHAGENFRMRQILEMDRRGEAGPGGAGGDAEDGPPPPPS